MATPTIAPSPITANAPHLDALETLFKALSDRTRLRILALLAKGEVCVCEIHDALGIPQPTASRHLAYLRRSGPGHRPSERSVGLLRAVRTGRPGRARGAWRRRAWARICDGEVLRGGRVLYQSLSPLRSGTSRSSLRVISSHVTTWPV